MNAKAGILIAVFFAIGFYAWKNGLIGGAAEVDTSSLQNGDAVAAQQKGKDLFEQWKYPAISMGIIIFVLAAAWKRTPEIVKYPLATALFLGWIYFSGR